MMNEQFEWLIDYLVVLKNILRSCSAAQVKFI